MASSKRVEEEEEAPLEYSDDSTLSLPSFIFYLSGVVGEAADVQVMIDLLRLHGFGHRKIYTKPDRSGFHGRNERVDLMRKLANYVAYMADNRHQEHRELMSKRAVRERLNHLISRMEASMLPPQQAFAAAATSRPQQQQVLFGTPSAQQSFSFSGGIGNSAQSTICGIKFSAAETNAFKALRDHLIGGMIRHVIPLDTATQPSA